MRYLAKSEDGRTVGEGRTIITAVNRAKKRGGVYVVDDKTGSIQWRKPEAALSFLEVIAAEIVDNLNGQDTGESYVLQGAKDDETVKVLAKHGIKMTDEIGEALMDIIGYADPFITDKEANLRGQAKVMRDMLLEIRNHAMKYGGVPKSADKLWARVDKVLADAGRN